METFSEDSLEDLTDEEVQNIIESINPEQLTDEQAEAIAEALSTAPDEVKESFEEEINVFGGQFDSYVPVGSAVPVGTRRVIVAASAAIAAAPAPTARRKGA